MNTPQLFTMYLLQGWTSS